MRRATTALALAWIAGGSVFGVQLAAASPAAGQHPAASNSQPRTVAPAKTAWYDEARPTTSTPAAPQPGVSKGDLLVSGTTISTGDLPLPLTASIPVIQHVTAFTALDFRIPKGATPATLTLKLNGFSTTKIASHLPSGVTPEACPTTSAWKAGDQQSIAAAPKYNCKTLSSFGQLSTDSKSIVFNGINRLIRGNTLSFVVLPGTLGLDRLIFAKPTRKTLSLLRFSTPPVAVPSVQPIPTPTQSAPTTSVVPPGQTGGGVTVPVPSEPAITSAPDPGSSPQIATPSTPLAHSVAAGPLDTHHARLAATALLVALVVTTFWLAVTDSSGRTFTTLRVLRALSAGGPIPDLPAKEWGIGRFKAARDGRPPTI